MPVFKPENLEHEKMWIMKEAQCLRKSAFSFCKARIEQEKSDASISSSERDVARPKVKERTKGNRVYEAGSIETLIRIVDENGGFIIRDTPLVLLQTCA